MKGKGLDEFFWGNYKQPKRKSLPKKHYAMNEYSVGVLCRYR